MLKKCVFLFVVAALFLGGFTVPSGSAQAARPQPPTVEGLPPRTVDMDNLAEPLQKALDLQASLTPEQLAGVRTVLDKYLPAMQAIHEGLATQGKPQRSEPVQMDTAIVDQMNTVIANIESEMAGVLNADQFALYQAVTKPAKTAAPLDSLGQSVEGGYTSYCWYSTYENTLAWYYSYYGYLNSYYSYYYNNTSNAYYAYYYAYYGWEDAGYALDYSAPLYMQTYYLGLWWSAYPYNAFYWSYYTYSDMNYAYYYAYYQYFYDTDYSGGYAYYAYLWNYYGYYYGYYSYLDSYYCEYYLEN
jgi:hypothetical protein